VQRIVLFLFLVLGLPAAIYWASHDFEAPGRNVRRFVEELHALGGPPTPVETAAPKPKEEYEAAKKKPAEKTDDPTAKEPAPTKPKPEPEASPIEEAQKLYDAGRFAAAARIFADLHERMHALATLGEAFARAFPVALPDAPYYIVNGGEFEGFGTEKAGLLNLRSPAGRSLSLPGSAVREKQKLERPKAIERLARKVALEGASPDIQGARLFALLHEAFAMGRPDAAAPLLERALEIDEARPFFLSSVRQRVAPEFQDDLYRAFGRCQVLPDDVPPTEVVAVTAPRKLGDGTLAPKRKPQRSSIRNEKALALVRKAGPHRELGRKLHRTVFLAGRENAQLKDIDTAVSELEKALEYYEDALELEDSNEIHALVRHCSKLAFQLRFWREQVGGR
jgi:tetratricopeptide (TPR) repeat protein